MATTTAFIFVGQAHQNDGGINPTHLIQLTEGNRPALILHSFDSRQQEQIVIPTLEGMVDDVYLVIAVYVLNCIVPPKPINNRNRDRLYDIFSEDERKALYAEVLEALKQIHTKVVFSILDGSYLLGQWERVKKYPNDFEIILPRVRRSFDAWSGEVITVEN